MLCELLTLASTDDVMPSLFVVWLYFLDVGVQKGYK